MAAATTSPSRAPAIACSVPSSNPLDHAAASNLKHLDHRTGGSELQAETSPVTELGGRHFLLAIVQRLDRAASRRAPWAASSNLSCSAAWTIRPFNVLDELVVLSFEKIVV